MIFRLDTMYNVANIFADRPREGPLRLRPGGGSLHSLPRARRGLPEGRRAARHLAGGSQLVAGVQRGRGGPGARWPHTQQIVPASVSRSKMIKEYKYADGSE